MAARLFQDMSLRSTPFCRQLFFVAWIAHFVGGCSVQHIRLDSSVPDWTPLVEPIPLAIGVHYSPEFLSYENRSVCAGMPDFVFEYRLGPPSVAMFDHVLKAMFRDVVAVQTWPPTSAVEPAVHGVLIPSIDSAQLPTFERTIAIACGISASVTYAISLYSPEGNLLASWSVTGLAIDETDTMALNFHLNKDRREAVQAALRSAASNFVRRFAEPPAVRHWLAGHGIQSYEPGGSSERGDSR